MNETAGSIRDFLLWLADVEHSERTADWGHGDRDSLRRQFVGAGFPDLSEDDWDFVRKGDFAVLRDICSTKIAVVLVMMTSVPEPPGK